MSRRRVRRWRVSLVATLALTGVGLFFASGTLLTAAAIPLAYVLYAAVSRVPADPELSVRRTIDRSDSRPGAAVEVTLTVENPTDYTFPDVRVVDGVPDGLAVSAGSPQVCTALAPGGTATLTYAVVATHGEYEFAEPVVRLRSLAASERLTATVRADGDDTLACATVREDGAVGTREQARAGIGPGQASASGLEFHAIREYEAGDPMTRIDWRHYAKTGEFVTVQYRDEGTTHVVIVVDARPVNRVARRAGHPTGTTLSAHAGERVERALNRAGAVTTVTAVGLDDDEIERALTPEGLPWAEATGRGGTGAQTVFQAVRSVGNETGGSTSNSTQSLATDGGPDETGRRLLSRLAPESHVVVCTPLLDEWPVSLLTELAAHDVPALLVSPDVTSGDSDGQRLAGIRRRTRIRSLERAGVAVESWDGEELFDRTLRRALQHLVTRQ